MVLEGHQLNILYGTVMHHRFIPRVNKFLYPMFYFHVPLMALEKKLGNDLLGINKFSLFSVHEVDHGDKKTSLMEWVQKILNEAGLNNIDKENISLITLPRVMGYVFNPISFFLCLDSEKNLRAVICEVNNTFGEQHIYVCYKKDHSVIYPQDEIIAQKIFHVSPFMKRDGFYKFRFSFNEKKFISFIDYYNDNNEKMLATSVTGDIASISNLRLIKAFLSYPFITLKVIFLIHWQALKIFFKGISYVPKPIQNKIIISHPSQLQNKE